MYYSVYVTVWSVENQTTETLNNECLFSVMIIDKGSYVAGMNYSSANHTEIINRKGQIFDQELEDIFNYLSQYEDKDCYINLYTEKLENDNDLMVDVNCYISNRMGQNVDRICEAYLLGVKCISGVDSDIFYEIK